MTQRFNADIKKPLQINIAKAQFIIKTVKEPPPVP